MSSALKCIEEQRSRNQSETIDILQNTYFTLTNTYDTNMGVGRTGTPDAHIHDSPQPILTALRSVPTAATLLVEIGPTSEYVTCRRSDPLHATHVAHIRPSTHSAQIRATIFEGKTLPARISLVIDIHEGSSISYSYSNSYLKVLRFR